LVSKADVACCTLPAQFLMSGGMCKDEQQAAALAAQFKKMSPSMVKLLTVGAGAVNTGLVYVKQARQLLASHALLVVALVVLLLALLLRWLGVM
jgi:stage V sporulation protein SpoVS